MTTQHFIWLAVGIALGYLAVPFILSLFRSRGAGG